MDPNSTIRRVICVFLLIFPAAVLSFPDDLIDLRFENISTSQGLAQSTVNCFLKDSRGFLWIGTCGGLDRYDGYDFKNYRPDPDKVSSLSHTYVQSLHEEVTDSGRILWIATQGGGLNRLDLKNDKLTHYLHDPEVPGSLSNDMITSMTVDPQGIIWLGTLGGGLNRFDPRQEIFSQYRHDPQNENTVSNDGINYLIQDRSGLLWIGTFSGELDCFNPLTGEFIHLARDPLSGKSLIGANIWRIFEDSRNNLWIGAQNGFYFLEKSGYSFGALNIKRNEIKFEACDFDDNDGEEWIIGIHEDRDGLLWLASFGGGLILFNPDEHAFRRFRHDPDEPQSLGNDDLKSVYEDYENGIIWIGSESSGISKYSRNRKPFTTYRHDPGNPHSIGQNNPNAIFEDNTGTIWIGLSTAGFDRFDPHTRRFRHHHFKSSAGFKTSCNKVQNFYQDSEGTIWIGTAGGLLSYDPLKEQFHRHLQKLPAGLEQQDIWIQAICQMPGDTSGTLWVATHLGLLAYEPATRAIRLYHNDPSDPLTLSNDLVVDLLPEHDCIWVGTMAGLNKFEPVTGNFTRFLHQPDDSGSISNNLTYDIHRDRSGRLWIGTDGGLNLMHETTGTFRHYTMEDGMPSNSVLTILEDEHGQLWLGTLNGLSRFDPESETFRNYDERDGLQGKEFWWWSALKARTGELYFGGNNGMNVFHPDSLGTNNHIPPIVLSDFEIFNRSVSPGDHTFITQAITESGEITLPWDKDIFTIKFAALDFNISDKNRYAYKLEGIDRDWVQTDASRRMATYTKLQPGTYTFHVKGSNNDGVWNETGRELKITILPPWWRTDLAYFFYIFFGSALVILIWRLQIHRLRVIHRLELEHLAAENLKQIDHVKSRFFANISHEFRTPLTLIQGPVRQLMEGRFTGNIKSQYRMILENTNRLLNLVTQLLDLSRLDAGKLTLQAGPVNIAPLLQGLVDSFQSLADQHRIELGCTCTLSQTEVYLDVPKFEQIINNLLSNAVKCTPDGGRISVDLDISPPDSRNVCRITVSNTGPGIPAAHLEKVFERFYQVGNGTGATVEGAGIGLALVKELVQLHHGEISVDSVPYEETRFIIKFPLGRDHLNATEIASAAETHSWHPEIPVQERPDLKPVYRGKRATRLLIVEDQKDLRTYIAEIFSKDHEILQAANGKEGLQIARNRQPDVVITDVMMPEMDGFELCRQLKTSEDTSHIPVIVITARAGQEDKLSGLEIGADDYITKPFDAHELYLRIQNLIEQRRRLHHKFISDPGIHPGKITTTSLDERFIRKLIGVIEENLSNPHFSITALEDLMHLSRSALYRKIVMLTGLNPSELIRYIRLVRAKQLLEQNGGNITEVAMHVGFNNVSYFSTCFAKQFGMNPSSYVRSLT